MNSQIGWKTLIRWPMNCPRGVKMTNDTRVGCNVPIGLLWPVQPDAAMRRLAAARLGVTQLLALGEAEEIATVALAKGLTRK